VLSVEGLVTRLGGRCIHDGVSFAVSRGQLVAIVGASGTGKSVLLREIVGLLRPGSGTIRLLDVDVWTAPADTLAAVRRRFGMMFQDGALFSSLTVAENVAVPLLEHGRLPRRLVWPVVQLRIALAGLPPDAGGKLPSELSGGMRKRAAIARALALEPEVLFLDEPTSGLDPVTARALDQLMRFLVDDLGITVVLVTHDLDTLLTVADRVIVLSQGKVAADGPVQEIARLDDDWLRSYFSARTMLGTGGNANGA
jgi:phospholipid/cholesterol/gamma-HCH transport system ATP-binding protein